MDASALERDIARLEKSFDSLEVWLAAATILVVIGLVIEYWHEIPESIHALKESKKWLWKPVCVILGGILITLGVAGELVVQFIASEKETELRKDNDSVFSGLNTEAANARLDAGKAIERAGKAVEDAGKANERASKNEKEAATLRKRAEDEAAARIKLQTQLSWRDLTKPKETQLAKRSCPLRGNNTT
jgi:hypothetical protein